MASSATGAVSRIVKEASKFFKLPWKITGPASGPEFLESVSQAGTYREVAPASQTKRVLVPQANPENVYKIAYYPREFRRADITVTHEMVSLGAQAPEAAVKPAEAEAEGSAEEPALQASGLPPAPGGHYVMGKEFHINDVPGDGYTR